MAPGYSIGFATYANLLMPEEENLVFFTCSLPSEAAGEEGTLVPVTLGEERGHFVMASSEVLVLRVGIECFEASLPKVFRGEGMGSWDNTV